MEEEVKGKVVIVNYKCDVCNTGYLNCIDKTSYKDDDGENQTIYTHQCSECGAMINLENLYYPHYKVIPDPNQKGD